MSGQYTSTNRVYDNAALFAADIPCIGHYLTNAAYDCVLSGKMHFVGPDQLHGLRRRLTTDIYAEEFNMLDNRAPWAVARDPARFDPAAGRGRHAQNYVGSNVHVGRWHHHLSYDEEAHFAAELRSAESLARVRRAYYGLVTYVDRKVGELIAALQEHRLWEDTAVVFTSDHGDMLCERSMVQKRAFYDPSCRVPLIVRLPRDVAAGTAVGEPVNLVDLPPTLLDLAGVPREGRLPMDGQSLMGLIDGTDTAPRTTFAEMHVEDNPVLCFMVRRGRYKLNLMAGVDAQLFDLEADPGEWDNLIGHPAHAAVEAELRQALADRFDFAAIEADVRRSIAARRLIREAMRPNRTLWDYTPAFDANKDAMQQYLG